MQIVIYIFVALYGVTLIFNLFSVVITWLIYSVRVNRNPTRKVAPIYCNYEDTEVNNNSVEENGFFGRQVRYFLYGVCKYVNLYVGHIPFHFIRLFLYKNILKVNLGKKCVVYKGVVFRDPFLVSIGNSTIIGDDCLIDGRGGVFIGDNCNLSSDVRIWSAQHGIQSPSFGYERKEVCIDDYCWISSNVIIMPGVKIGKGCVIAAGAVVTKNCEEFGIYAGVPAHRIGERTRNLTYNFSGEHDWFV